MDNPSITDKTKPKEPLLSIKPPPPPPATLSPTCSPKSVKSPNSSSIECFEDVREITRIEQPQADVKSKENQCAEDAEDDFGDFQAAG